MRRNHLYHLVDPSPWPIASAFAAFFLLSGVGFWFNRIAYGGTIFIFGLLLTLLCMYFWFRDVAVEASYLGYHTLIVRAGLKLGFYMFIASEVMLFFGFFWAFFHSSLCPAITIGSHWPPTGISFIDPYHYPLYNTILLIISGFAITWAHKAFALGNFREAMDAILWTLALGFFFVYLQCKEYYAAAYNFSDGIYGATFYSLTGLHGFHVIVGAFFILMCFFRLIRQHFLRTHYLGFVCAIWYWHFVDAVWILLFLSVYCWGNW